MSQSVEEGIWKNHDLRPISRFPIFFKRCTVTYTNKQWKYERWKI